MNQAEVIVLIYKSLPYSDQVITLDLQEARAVRFEWCGESFRVSDSLAVETIDGPILKSCNLSILFEALLKQTHAFMSVR